MERRDGPDFDFNEPLLESALGTPPLEDGDVKVAMAFLQSVALRPPHRVRRILPMR